MLLLLPLFVYITTYQLRSQDLVAGPRSRSKTLVNRFLSTVNIIKPSGRTYKCK